MADVFLQRTGRRPYTFELLAAGARIGVLRYPHEKLRNGVAETADGGWEIPRTPLFGSEIPVLAPGGRREIGHVYQRIWLGGADFALDDIRYELRGVSVMRRTWALTAVGGETLHLTLSGAMARRLGPIAIDRPGAVLLGFYLAFLRMRVKPRGAAAGAPGG